MYISEGERFNKDFAAYEYERRNKAHAIKKEIYQQKKNEIYERERTRWERMDYEYLKNENKIMMNKEKNLVGRKNNPGMAFNPLTLQYDNSVQGEILKKRDEESKFRALMRATNIDKHSNQGYNILNGEDRTIMQKRMQNEIDPEVYKKNIGAYNELYNQTRYNRKEYGILNDVNFNQPQMRYDNRGGYQEYQDNNQQMNNQNPQQFNNQVPQMNRQYNEEPQFNQIPPQMNRRNTPLEQQQNMNQQYDPRQDPNYNQQYDPRNDPNYNQQYDPRQDPNYNQQYDPRNDPNYNQNYDNYNQQNINQQYDPNYNQQYDPNYQQYNQSQNNNQNFNNNRNQ